MNTEPQHQRSKKLERHPRITVLIRAEDNPWNWAEVRGHVVGATTG